MFHGAITALITPFRGGKVDSDRLRANVESQIAQSIDGLVPCGTTGESPTLSHEEHNHVIDVVVSAKGRVPVIAGTGSNSTDEALAMTRHAKEVGATASLQVNPYYNKPTQEGLYRHFMTIADAVELPMVLYNIPGRTAVQLSIGTIARLAKHPNIVAIKEATGSLDVASEIAATCPKLTILSGDDSLTLPLMSVGGKGVISVASNIIPKRVHDLVALGLAGKWDEARKLHLELFPLFKGLFVETNPIPVKTAAMMMGTDTGELRLPMCELSDASRPGLTALLQKFSLIK